MKNLSAFYLIGMLLIQQVLPAQPGTLDSTFSKDGKVITNIGQGNSNNSVAIQTNGKIIVAGGFYNGSNNDFVLVRYKSGGSIDNAFGLNGKVTTDLGGDEICNAIAIQPDDKIIIAGYSQTASGADFALVRYLPNGTLDSGFGKKGKVITDVNSKNNYGYALMLQPDGKIIEVGVSGKDITLLRYTIKGKPDTSFGEAGVVVTNLTGEVRANSVALQTDGKIVVAGNQPTIYSGDSYNFFLVRYNTNGSLDKGFGDHGKVITPIWHFDAYGYYFHCNSLAIQPDGKIVVVGSLFSPRQSALVRYKSNGDIDSSFATNGLIYFSGAACDDRALIIQNKKIIVSGTLYQDFALWSFKPNGNFDNSFGTQGMARTNFGHNDEGSSVVVQADGKLLQAGSSNRSIAVARFIGETGLVPNAAATHTRNNIVKTIHIFPNPVTNVLTIQGLSPNCIKSVSIINADGKVLRKEVVSGIDYSCNLNNLSPGIYFIRIEEYAKVSMMKFVKE